MVEEHTDNGFKSISVGIISTLSCAIVLGSYYYAYSVDSNQTNEKSQWRGEHSKMLDKRLDRLEQSQVKLEEKLDKNSEKITDKLDRLLEQGSIREEEHRPIIKNGR